MSRKLLSCQRTTKMGSCPQASLTRYSLHAARVKCSNLTSNPRNSKEASSSVLQFYKAWVQNVQCRRVCIGSVATHLPPQGCLTTTAEHVMGYLFYTSGW